MQPRLAQLEYELEAAAEGLEAEHDSRYRAARQQYLRQLLGDPNQPRHVRGWIRQELNRLARIQHAQQSSRRGPGGSARYLRGVPGLDVGHMLGKHDQHHPSHFRLEDARFNRARPGLSRRVGLFHKYRESEAEFENTLQELELGLQEAAQELEAPEPFYTRVTPIPGIGNKEGHEILTRMAMRGLPLSAADRSAILLGVIRPDRGGKSYWNFPRSAIESLKARAQPSHSLRPTPSSTVVTALRLIRSRFVRLYLRTMRARSRATALQWLGEALHLLQDSFSSAHVERAGGTGRICYIRAFYVRFGWPPLSRAPREHNAPSDPRDDVYLNGALRREARAAIRASRVFLRMALHHLRTPRSPSRQADLRRFIRKYLS